MKKIGARKASNLYKLSEILSSFTGSLSFIFLIVRRMFLVSFTSSKGSSSSSSSSSSSDEELSEDDFSDDGVSGLSDTSLSRFSFDLVVLDLVVGAMFSMLFNPLIALEKEFESNWINGNAIQLKKAIRFNGKINSTNMTRGMSKKSSMV